MIDKPDQRPPLDYESRLDESVQRFRERRDGALGGILSFGVVVGGVFLFIVSNLQLGGAQHRSPATIVVPIGAALLAGGILIGIAYHRWTRRGSKAFAAGLLIGVGVALLVEGICFAALR